MFRSELLRQLAKSPNATATFDIFESVLQALRSSKDSCLAYEHVQGNADLRKQIAIQSFNWGGAISEDDIAALATAVEDQIREEGPEVGSEVVGKAVLDRLRTLDPVAYLRFASVYKGFEDLTDFEREVGLLQKTTTPKGTGAPT